MLDQEKYLLIIRGDIVKDMNKILIKIELFYDYNFVYTV